jgi:B12-binding domain/radical SAM domain protein
VGKSKKIRIAFRVFSGNRLTMPLLLSIWERNGLDRCFDILLVDAEPGRLDAARIARLRTSDVCLYSFMTPHLPLVAAEIRDLRAAGRASPLLVAGGPHVSGEQELARACGFDILFSGAAEAAFLRFGLDLLAAKIKAGEDPVVYRPAQAATAGNNEDAEWEKHIPVSRHFRTVPPLEIARGCFWKCRYCQTGAAKPRYRSEDSIGLYLEQLLRRGMPRLGFISPSALEFGAAGPARPSLERIGRLLEQCRQAGFRFIEFGIFPTEIRPDTVSAEALQLLRRFVSNRRLTFGAQSAIDARLAAIGRGHKMDDVENAVALANEAGFAANLDFIIALPGETSAERRALLDFIANLRKKHRVYIQLHHFFPLAGSAFAYRLPSFLSAGERRVFGALKKDGLASDWWEEGERQARSFFDWLKRDFPAILDQYH